MTSLRRNQSLPEIVALRRLMVMIEQNDDGAHYDARNAMVYEALAVAAYYGLPCGFRIDPAETEWPVAYIKLPTGQVSWHLPQFPEPWDGHTTEEKYERIRKYLEGA